MTNQKTEKSDPIVWFAYDGECPLCTMAAQALHIRKDVGDLQLVNAREDLEHPLIQEITRLGLDLDDGMVLKYRGICYHGDNALHMMALLGSPSGWFNRLNAILFRSKTVARICYPSMRGVRNLLLRRLGVGKIRNLQQSPSELQPIFKSIFGKEWENLPPVMRTHYAIRPYSEDRVVVEGVLDVEVSIFMRMMSRLSGMLISRSGKNIPVKVVFRSGIESADFYFDRTFDFPQGKQAFTSRMAPIGGNELVEYMGLGIGWKMAFSWNGEKILLSHRGYVWRVFGLLLPIPFGLILGKGEAEETPLSETEFEMWTHAKHPLFGNSFAYAGKFKITEVECGSEF